RNRLTKWAWMARGCGNRRAGTVAEEARMRLKLRSIALAGGVALIAVGAPGARAAEPLLTQRIGTSNCGRLAGHLEPGEGLGNPVNLMAYSWAQGYISAANISLVEADAKHVDMGQLDKAKVISMLLTWCKANPDKQPLSALNEYLKKSPKVKIKWNKGT